PNANSIRVEFTLDQPLCGNHNPHDKSAGIPPCRPTGGCPPRFPDVPAFSTYFNAANFLYDDGVVSGYIDGTFRPYNLTTRGQLAKIVVLAQGWAIYAPATPTFRDVPATHPFYRYVETAHTH